MSLAQELAAHDTEAFMETEKSEKYRAPVQPKGLEVSVQVDDLHIDWKRVSYIANYVAEYMAYEFPQRERAENLLSTITNEILESVINLAPDQTVLQINCKLVDKKLVLDVTHYVRAEISSSYESFVKNLGEDNSDNAYLEMLISEATPETYFNQLGLMMLGYDFGVRLSLDRETEANQFCTHVNVLDEVLSK